MRFTAKCAKCRERDRNIPADCKAGKTHPDTEAPSPFNGSDLVEVGL